MLALDFTRCNREGGLVINLANIMPPGPERIIITKIFLGQDRSKCELIYLRGSRRKGTTRASGCDDPVRNTALYCGGSDRSIRSRLKQVVEMLISR